MTVATFYPTREYRGYISAHGSCSAVPVDYYPDVQTCVDGSVPAEANYIYVNNYYTWYGYPPPGLEDNYDVRRGSLIFDTSSLPDDIGIISAKIVLHTVAGATLDRSVSLCAVSGEGLHDPPEASDYYTLLPHVILHGSVDVTTQVANAAIEIELNDTGIAAISKTGMTKFGLRLSTDIAASSPKLDSATNAERCSVWARVDGDPSYRPYLEVTYGSIPSVTTDAATDITTVTATLNGTLDDDAGAACDCGFEWGLTDAYGNTTPTDSKTTGQSFSQPITGLEPGTTYHFRAFATGAAGTGYGADLTFTTLGKVYPTEALARVTGLIHRYQPGTFSLEVFFGDVTAEFDIRDYFYPPSEGTPTEEREIVPPYFKPGWTPPTPPEDVFAGAEARAEAGAPAPPTPAPNYRDVYLKPTIKSPFDITKVVYESAVLTSEVSSNPFIRTASKAFAAMIKILNPWVFWGR